MYCSAYYTDPHDYGFLDLDPQKYADPRLKIQGAKTVINIKISKKITFVIFFKEKLQAWNRI